MNGAAILQVEDDDNDVHFLRFAFKALNLDNPLHVVRDGQEAIEYLSGSGAYADRDRHPLPQLVLLDLKMPRKTGMDVLRWIRSQPSLRRIVVIIFSASGNASDVDTAYDIGANAFLVKPAGMDKLIELLRDICRFWLTQNQFGRLDGRT